MRVTLAPPESQKPKNIPRPNCSSFLPTPIRRTQKVVSTPLKSAALIFKRNTQSLFSLLCSRNGLHNKPRYTLHVSHCIMSFITVYNNKDRSIFQFCGCNALNTFSVVHYHSTGTRIASYTYISVVSFYPNDLILQSSICFLILSSARHNPHPPSVLSDGPTCLQPSVYVHM